MSSDGREQYEALPEPIKAAISFAEWKWLPDGDKAKLERAETEPEVDE